MLDSRLLRQELDFVKERLALRGGAMDFSSFEALEDERKTLQVKTQELQNERNSASKAIGVKKSKGEDATAEMAAVRALGDELKASEEKLTLILEKLHDFMLRIPNLPHASVPAGQDETCNKEVRKVGVKRTIEAPRDHVALGEGLGLIDFEQAVKMSGSRFVTLSGGLARMQRALTQMMLNTHIEEHGYEEVYVPYLVNQSALMGTGQLPKFEADLFKTAGEQAFYLIPTAEVPVTNLIQDKILTEKDLPKKWVCHTPCFRSEAGSYGRDTRGMIRQHQFEKVELVQAVKPEDSFEALEALLGHAEVILQKLELPYRVVNLCGGDLGFASAKTYDLEVWLPSQNTYREISSCSNFEAFQARRLMARFKSDEGKTTLLHTLNGSALAVGRALLAVMENYQETDGSIVVPDVLRPYMGGVSKIG